MANIKNKIKNIINKITLGRFIKYLPLVVIFLTIFCMVIIKKYSKIDAWPLDLKYTGFDNFVTYFKFPLQFFLISLTLWGILIAYQTYLDTKKQFIILNNASLKTSDVKAELLPFHRDNQNIKKLFLLFEITNNGNTPAQDTEVGIDIISNIAKLNMSKPNKIPELVYPQESYTFSIEIGKTIQECEEMMSSYPIFTITINTKYTNIYGMEYNVIEIYEYKYNEIPLLIESKFSKFELYN